MIDILQKYLQQYGWTFETVEDNTLLTGFIDDNRMSYPVTLSVKEDVISFTVTFRADTAAITQNASIQTLLLRFNFAWPMVKIGLDEEFSVVLALDLPRKAITYDAFALGLDIFSDTAQMLADELSEVIKV